MTSNINLPEGSSCKTRNPTPAEYARPFIGGFVENAEEGVKAFVSELDKYKDFSDGTQIQGLKALYCSYVLALNYLKDDEPGQYEMVKGKSLEVHQKFRDHLKKMHEIIPKAANMSDEANFKKLAEFIADIAKNHEAKHLRNETLFTDPEQILSVEVKRTGFERTRRQS